MRKSSFRRVFGYEKTRWGKLVELWDDYVIDPYYKYVGYPISAVRHFFWNLAWLLPHAWKWRGFDHHYSLDLYLDSLEKLGYELMRYDNCTLSRRNGRRCLTAARQLRKVSKENTTIEDRAYKNWSSRRRDKFIPLKDGMTEWADEELQDNAMGMDRKEYSNKMWHIIHKRTSKEEEEYFKESWAYLVKWHRHWWD